MASNHIVAAQVQYFRALAANSTDSSFTAKTPTATAPSGAGVFPLDQQSYAKLRVTPYGVGTDGTTFSIRVIGWKPVPNVTDGTFLWIPTILTEYVCTLSAYVGVAGQVIDETQRFADTLALVASVGGTDGQNTTKYSPANDTPAWFVVDTQGSEKVEFLFDMTGATSGNAVCHYL